MAPVALAGGGVESVNVADELVKVFMYKSQFFIFLPCFYLKFAPSGRTNIRMRFMPDHFYRQPSPCISSCGAGIMRCEAVVQIGRNTSIETIITASQDIYKPVFHFSGAL